MMGCRIHGDMANCGSDGTHIDCADARLDEARAEIVRLKAELDQRAEHIAELEQSHEAVVIANDAGTELLSRAKERIAELEQKLYNVTDGPDAS